MTQMQPNGYDDPMARYAYMQAQQQRQPQQSRTQQVAQQFAQQMMQQPAQNAAQGYGQLAAGIGMGLANYQKQGEQFPVAPGGGNPSLMTGLANLFTSRNNGGLR